MATAKITLVDDSQPGFLVINVEVRSDAGVVLATHAIRLTDADIEGKRISEIVPLLAARLAKLSLKTVLEGRTVTVSP